MFPLKFWNSKDICSDITNFAVQLTHKHVHRLEIGKAPFSHQKRFCARVSLDFNDFISEKEYTLFVMLT